MISPQDLQDLTTRFKVELDAYFVAKKADIQAMVQQQLTSAGIQPLTSAQLMNFITALKAQGVKSWNGNGITLEFFPTVTTP